MGTALLTLTEIRACERDLMHGLPPGALMQRAGSAAAQAITARHAPRRVVVLCGPGNNGGDGYICAAELRAAGCEVHVVAAGGPPSSEDARGAHAQWLAGGGEVHAACPDDERFDVVVDALFGIGLQRPLGGAYRAAVDWLNAQDAPVVALDVPSGLDADRGTWVGDTPGVIARTTVTFLADKPGLHTAAGCEAAGTVVVESLGNAPAAATGHLTDTNDFAALLAPRRRDTHKGTFGNLAVVGGARGMVGAVLLAARAALRLGAGRVYVSCLGAPELQFDPAQPELMLRSLGNLPQVDALVAGCGMGSETGSREALEQVLSVKAPLVLDADALNLVAAQADLRRLLLARDAPHILTPHPLEAARLLGTSAAAVQAERVASAVELARTLSSWIVLKGAGSVIAAPEGAWWINPTGGPALATAGTGDVLAGMLGALLAQGFDARTAACGAVWLHGAAADAFAGDVGLVAGEIALRAAGAWNALRRASV
jgi:ADP-dependent NAD(P)H-hydrate dehydratase / NAD(P)H-hydrate epimerase